MADILKKAWWVLLLRGISAILFALLLLFSPGLVLVGGLFSFVVLFAIYALVDGISTIAGAIMNREGQWGLVLLWGVISVIAGLVALSTPVVSVLVVFTVRIMIFIVAFRSIVGGMLEIYSAWRLRQEIDNEWLLAINGIFGVLFGLILLARPITGIEVLVILTAFYLLMSGTMQIVLGFKVRGWSDVLVAKEPVVTS
ncbi:MAG: DUF308 domain-containing protein [Chloroflexota bacterium]